MTDMNILDLFLKASLLVKLIMLILIGFSIASWAIIIQRTRILNAAAREAEAFEDKFWSGIELSRLYQESQGKRDNLSGSEQIFYSGFKEFVSNTWIQYSTLGLDSELGGAARYYIDHYYDFFEQMQGGLYAD